MCFDECSYNLHVAACESVKIDNSGDTASKQGTAAAAPNNEQPMQVQKGAAEQRYNLDGLTDTSTAQQPPVNTNRVDDASEAILEERQGESAPSAPGHTEEEIMRRLKPHRVAVDHICPAEKWPQFRASLLAGGYRLSVQQVVNMAIGMLQDDSKSEHSPL